MKINSIVLQRLNELEEKAKSVAQTSFVNFSGAGVSTELFHEWSTSVLNVLQRIFGETSVHYQKFSSLTEKFNGGEFEFQSCHGIFKAAKEDYEGGFLFNLRSIISGEIVADVLDQAQELLQNKFKDLACVAAGIALEISLKDLCTREGIAHANLNRMNADLAKQGVYNLIMQNQIIAWASLRNSAAHGKWNEYSHDEVKAMITGVTQFIANHL